MSTNSKRLLLLMVTIVVFAIVLVLLYPSWSGPRYVATSYVSVKGFTNAIYSHSFEVNTSHATRGVLRLESVPVVGAPFGVPNKNAAGVRIVTIADTEEAARRAATDAAALLCIKVNELYGFSAVVVPNAEAPHRYSLLQDTLKPKANRLMRRLRDALR